MLTKQRLAQFSETICHCISGHSPIAGLRAAIALLRLKQLAFLNTCSIPVQNKLFSVTLHSESHVAGFDSYLMLLITITKALSVAVVPLIDGFTGVYTLPVFDFTPQRSRGGANEQ